MTFQIVSTNSDRQPRWLVNPRPPKGLANPLICGVCGADEDAEAGRTDSESQEGGGLIMQLVDEEGEKLPPFVFTLKSDVDRILDLMYRVGYLQAFTVGPGLSSWAQGEYP